MLVLNYFVASLKSMMASGWKAFGVALASACAAFAPISVMLGIASAIILYDAVQGYKVGKKYGLTKIESRKIWKSIRKLKDANMLILIAFAFDAWIITSFNLHAAEIAAGIVVGTEVWSLLETYCELHQDKRIVRILLKVMKAKGEKYGLSLDDEDLKKPEEPKQ